MDNKIMKPALLFEYEKISDTIMNLGNKVSLKLEVTFGGADKNGNKLRNYNEYRYHSNKYDNVDNLVSVSRKFDSYLVIEYPKSVEDGKGKNEKIFIFSYSLDGLLAKMRELDNKYFEPFMKDEKTGELLMAPSKISYVSSSPSFGSKIEFSQDIYERYDEHNTLIEKDFGVRIGFNEEFYFTVRAFTVWKSLLNYISHCDLYLWGSTLLAPFTANLVGNAVTELNGGFSGNTRYRSFYAPDPDDIAEAKETVTVNRTKPLTREDRKKSFFDA